MAKKIYPPYIDGTLPACALDSSGNGELTIPFAFNEANSEKDIN